MLDQYRLEIDRINQEIVDLVEQRMNVVKKIHSEKLENDMAVRDKNREKEVVQAFQDRFEDKDMDPEAGEKFAELLIDIAVKEQRDNR